MQHDSFGGFTQVPQSLNRYSYVENNPVNLTHPSGHFPHMTDGGAGVPVRLPGLLAGDIAYFYADQGRTWNELPPDVRNALKASFVTEGVYLDSCGNTSSMEGTALEPALWGAGAVGAGRLVWLMPQLGAGATSTLCADGDCTNEIARIDQGVNTAQGPVRLLSDIRPYSELANQVSGTGLQRHHIIEQRFADILGINPNRMLSVVLSRADHLKFTNAWLGQIGRNGMKTPVTTTNASPDEIWLAAQRIYQDYPTLLEAARRTIFGQ